MDPTARNQLLRKYAPNEWSAQTLRQISQKLDQEADSTSYQFLYDLSTQQATPDELRQRLLQSKIGWTHPDWDEYRLKLEEEDEFTQNPFEVVEGVLECTKCKSKRVYYYQKQVRSCDESATTYATCTACGNKWTYSG